MSSIALIWGQSLRKFLAQIVSNTGYIAEVLISGGQKAGQKGASTLETVAWDYAGIKLKKKGLISISDFIVRNAFSIISFSRYTFKISSPFK